MWSIYLIILREAQIWNNCEIGAVYVIKGHVPDNTIVICWHDLHIEPILYSKRTGRHNRKTTNRTSVVIQIRLPHKCSSILMCNLRLK